MTKKEQEKQHIVNDRRKAINEYERSFLGSILAYTSDEIPQLRIKSECFYNQNHAHIFKTILAQRREGKKPDILTVGLDPDIREKVGADYVSSLTNEIPSTVNIRCYEDEIIKDYQSRTAKSATEVFKKRIEAADFHGDIEPAIREYIGILSGVLSDNNEAYIKSAAEILSMNFPDIKWVIPNLVGEGLTMVIGSPKIGKSWLALSLSIAAASGGTFLGELTANKTDVLYIALEDSERRIQGRLRKLQAENLDNLQVTTKWKNSYIGLENYLEKNTNIGLVIIDTLAIFTNIDDFNDYAETTRATSQIKGIADKFQTAIIFLHHAKKDGKESDKADWMESALGSTGLAGAPDNTIFIKRDRSKKKTEPTARLYATGRDIADIGYILKMNNDCGWVITNKQASSQNSSKSEPWDQYREGMKNG